MDLGGSSSDDGLAQTHRALQDGWQPRPATDGVRVLALDGGGTRGLITIEMLKALEETTGRRVHELFDVIGGTSTGGIIALALQEGFPLARIEELYRQLSVSVFKQTPRHVAASNLLMTGAIHKAAALEAILHDLFHEAAPEAEEQAAETACPTSDDGSEAAEAAEAARAASPPDTPAAARLERPRLLWRKAAAAFREARSRRRPERGPAEGASMLYRRAEQERRYSERIQVARCGAGEADSPARPPNVFVVACAVSQLPPSLFLFRNYELPAAAAAARSAAPPIPGSSSLSQAEAGRATSAAPSFFPPASFLSPSGGAPAVYQDGGLLANNPAALALAEAKALYPGAKIACVASFGTGAFEPRPVAKPTSFAHALSTLAGAATRTEEVHSLLCGVFGEGGGEAGATHYYRFNPPVPTAKQGRMDDTSPQVLLQYQALGRAYVSDGLGAADMAALAQRLAAASPAAPRPPGAWLAPAWWGATARDMMRQWLARRPRPLASFGRRSRL